MVQLYKNGGERKIELSQGEQILNLTFNPSVDKVENKPSQASGTVYQAGKHHDLKEQLLSEDNGQGNTEKEALLDLVKKLLKQAEDAKKDHLVSALKMLQGKIIAEGLGFAHAKYVPYSQRD